MASLQTHGATEKIKTTYVVTSFSFTHKPISFYITSLKRDFLSSDKITGVSITRQGVGRFKESFDRRIDPRGNVYYWLSGETPIEEDLPDSDGRSLKENNITITPINCNLTCERELARLRSCDLPSWRT